MNLNYQSVRVKITMQHGKYVKMVNIQMYILKAQATQKQQKFKETKMIDVMTIVHRKKAISCISIIFSSPNLMQNYIILCYNAIFTLGVIHKIEIITNTKNIAPFLRANDESTPTKKNQVRMQQELLNT